MLIALKCGGQIRHKLHAPADDVAATCFERLPVIEKLAGVVLRAVQLLPRRILHIPAVDLGER